MVVSGNRGVKVFGSLGRPRVVHADNQAGGNSPLGAAAPRSLERSDTRHEELMDSSCKATSTETAGLPVPTSGCSVVVSPERAPARMHSAGTPVPTQESVGHRNESDSIFIYSLPYRP